MAGILGPRRRLSRLSWNLSSSAIIPGLMIEPVLQRPPREPLVPPGGSDLHQRDMTATFSADLSLHQAQDLLLAASQWLPIDGDPDATLGQLIESNSTGPLRLGYGAWRDLLLGVQFRNGRGDLISA